MKNKFGLKARSPAHAKDTDARAKQATVLAHPRGDREGLEGIAGPSFGSLGRRENIRDVNS
jgi:hypothetical protein